VQVTSDTQDLKPSIQRVVDGQELSMQEAAAALDVIMTGGATPAQVGALLTALRMRGETVAEIAGFALTMRKHALRVELADDLRPVIDTCGTGGDAAGTFNISTTAALVVAGAGVRVAKHGNRAITSKCGSGDVLEGLGLRIELPPEAVAECISRTGFGFMFAPAFHPAMRYVGPTRREIGVRTIFNVLGPLTNPAGVRRQLIGVGDRRIARTLADVMGLLGAEKVLIVSGPGGMDEIGLDSETGVVDFDCDHLGARSYDLSPERFGLERAERAALRGGTVEENVGITRSVLGGAEGPARSAVLINAGAAIYASGAADTIKAGIELAARSIDSGSAKAVLDQVVELSNDLAERAGAEAPA
jgi:anthranilate phosphoribosyltransferase